MFDIAQIPFSCFGSWLNISPVIAEKTHAEDLHLVSHQTGLHPVLRLVPTDGHTRATTTIVATPAQLTWQHPHGRVEAAFEDATTIRIRGEGLGLWVLASSESLTPFSGTYFFRDPVDGSHVFTVYETGRRYRVTVLTGQTVETVGVQALGTAERGLHLGAGHAWEIAVEEFDNARPAYTPRADFAGVVRAAHERFSGFARRVAGRGSSRDAAAELAAYVLWSATVRPAGFLNRHAVLMSKHWMDKVWSWDHCFNSIALAAGEPRLALDQFHLPFDHQDPGGALPDSVTHSEVLYNFVKPPVHGWALRHLRDRLPPLSRADKELIYERLSRWTGFWLSARRAPGQALPHYQHGNDSGWDNATTFDPARVIQSADLAAFLLLQTRELAKLARELGDGQAADGWDAVCEQIRDAITGLWDGSRFTARNPETGHSWTSHSLLDLIPIVAGTELPRHIRDALAAHIQDHLTEYGLATELPASPHYRPDGYWRGPIWAPATVLIEDGLRRCGYTTLADEISSRFRALCEKSGFAENFDALTGQGLRDRAYTWTASAYLILAAGQV
ncbi:MAG TPA: trehalase family glycosidase [Candidatus Limnocylindrales bacterium]